MLLVLSQLCCVLGINSLISHNHARTPFNPHTLIMKYKNKVSIQYADITFCTLTLTAYYGILFRGLQWLQLKECMPVRSLIKTKINKVHISAHCYYMNNLNIWFR